MRLFISRGFLVTEEGQEDVVTNLDGVDVKKTLAGRDKGKIDCCTKLETEGEKDAMCK